MIFLNAKQQYILILIIAFAFCTSGIWMYPIYILDEAKNAEAAREMLANQRWFTPTFNDKLRVDKPPLHYYFMMLSYKMFGVSAFSARIFSGVFGAMTILSSFYYAQKFLNPKIAIYTLLVLLSSVFFLLEFHLAVPDPYFIFFVSFALFQFYDFHLNRKRISWWLFYLSVGLSVLVKGPIGLLLIGLMILIFLVTKKRFRIQQLLEYKPILGGLFSLLICAPWFIMAHKETQGEFTKGFFFQHNLERFGSEMEGHGGIFLITILFVLLGLLPMAFFLSGAMRKVYKERKTHEFLRFAWIIGSTWIAFFSLSSTKLPNYTMPIYPFLAILIGYYLQQIIQSKSHRTLPFQISFFLIVLVSVLLPAAVYYALTYVEVQLREVNFQSFWLIIVGVGAAIALFYYGKGKIRKSILSIVISWGLLNFALFFSVFPALTSQNPVSLTKKIIGTQADILLYKSYDPAFLINYKRTFPKTENQIEVKQFFERNPNAYLITKEKYFTSEIQKITDSVVVRQKALFENYTTIIARKKWNKTINIHQ